MSTLMLMMDTDEYTRADGDAITADTEAHELIRLSNKVFIR